MKYFIDYTKGSGSGCDELFNTRQEAENHMSFWTEEERQDCIIIELTDSGTREEFITALIEGTR